MNIFFLSFDPVRAAKAHCDKHVVKMLLESTQLLWTAQHVATEGRIPDLETAPTTLSGSRHGYAPTHRNHPCAIWARASLANYNWLCELAMALAEEYHFRWPARETPHACEAHVHWLRNHPPPLPLGPLSPPAQAMPDLYKVPDFAVAAYRAYYTGDKADRGLLVYTRRAIPAWLVLSAEAVGCLAAAFPVSA
jgi:hypothetical protein